MKKLLLAALVAAVTVQPVSAAETFVDKMSREHTGDNPVATPAAEAKPAQPAAGAEVRYGTVEGTAVSGYLAVPEGGAEGLPALIVIHEWWGLNDNIRAMAGRFAGEGYQALAVDLYEGESATDRDGAAALMKASTKNKGRLEENIRQAYAYLKDERKAGRVGVIGWCFGGGWSLRTALLFPDGIDAAAIYYGRLVTDPAELEPLQMPILGIFGSLDKGIPVAEVRKFEEALRSLDKKAAIHVYEGADHAFANPSGKRYQKEAAEDAWLKTVEFFAGSLK